MGGIRHCIERADAVVIDITEINPNVEWEMRTTFDAVPPEAVLLCWNVNSPPNETTKQFPAASEERLHQIVGSDALRRCARYPYRRVVVDADMLDLVTRTYPDADSMSLAVATCLAGGLPRPTPAHPWRRNLRLLTQITALLALVVGGFLWVRTSADNWFADPARRQTHGGSGLSANDVVVAHVSPSARIPREERLRFWELLLERTKRLPEVRSGALIDVLPLAAVGPALLAIASPSPNSPLSQEAYLFRTSVDYLATIELPLLAGRWFDPQDPTTLAPSPLWPTR